MEQIVDMYGTPIEVGNELLFARFSKVIPGIVLRITAKSLVVSAYMDTTRKYGEHSDIPIQTNLNLHDGVVYLRKDRLKGCYLRNKIVTIPECFGYYLNNNFHMIV